MPTYSLFAVAYQLKLHLHLRVGGRACALCGALLVHTLTLEKACRHVSGCWISVEKQ